MPRHQTKPAAIRLIPRLRLMVRALGLGAAAPSVDNAGKRIRRAAMHRLAAHRA